MSERRIDPAFLVAHWDTVWGSDEWGAPARGLGEADTPMLDPNDPGIWGSAIDDTRGIENIRMIISDWYVDEFGNRCRSITAA